MIADAFKKMSGETEMRPKTVRTDKGCKFYNGAISKLLKDYFN